MSPFCSLSSPSLQDLFKGFARHLSHLLTEDQNPARKTGELAAVETTAKVILMLNEVMSAEGVHVLVSCQRGCFFSCSEGRSTETH